MGFAQDSVQSKLKYAWYILQFGHPKKELEQSMMWHKRGFPSIYFDNVDLTVAAFWRPI